jgi:cyclophilin family peptidyl-prolyl cis-trans isomerase
VRALVVDDSKPSRSILARVLRDLKFDCTEATNGLENLRGTLAMARTNDIHSATAQFFINLIDNDFLNHSPGNYGYAVFGRVTSGMDVVDAIAGVATTRRRGHGDVPVDDVVVLSVTREATA